MKNDLSKEILEENKEKLENLHEAAVNLENIHDKDEVYKFSIDSAKKILDFYISTILVEDEKGLLVKASHHHSIDKGDILEEDKGIYGMTYKNKESYIINDIDNHSKAMPKSPNFNSVISVPIGDYGVFQVISKEVDYFNEHDLEMAKILVKHIEEAVKRIDYEEELRKSREKYRLITENSNDMISLFNFDLEPIFVNEAHERILGYDKEYLKYKKVTNFVHPDFKDNVEDSLNEIIENESEKTIETKFRCKDGDYIWIESNIGILSDSDKTKKLVIVSRDITERKKAEQKLKETEKLYKSIFENTGNPMIIVEDDKTISLVNQEFTELTGYSKEEVENKTELSDFIIEEDFERIKDYHEKRRDEPDPVPNEYAFKIINKFGHPLDVFCKVGLIPNSSKRVTSIMSISKYKKTMEELRKSQETFRVMFENMSYGMLLINPDFEIIEVNPKLRNILGYKEGELNNKNLHEIIDSKNDDKLKEIKEELLRKESDTKKLEIKVINKKGEKIDFILNMSVVFDTDDEPLYFLCDLKKAD